MYLYTISDTHYAIYLEDACEDVYIVEPIILYDYKPNGELVDKDTKEIFAYYPLKNEVDCRALFLQAWADGKRIALPRTKEENQMDFFYIDSLNELEEGAFHVMEPVRGSEKADPLQQPVIVPGSVFGRDGSRYGYGKGYYARFFAKNPKLKRYAVCYANQLEESLVTDIYDVEMHEIYTETEVIRKGV